MKAYQWNKHQTIVVRHVIYGLVNYQVTSSSSPRKSHLKQASKIDSLKVISILRSTNATNEEVRFILDSQSGQLYGILDSKGNPVKILRTDIEVPFGKVYVIECVLE